MKINVFLVCLIVGCVLVSICSGQKAPITSVRRGHKNRVEYVKAEINKSHLDKGSATNPATRAYAQTMGNRNDDAGHLIAQRLGGTGKDTYNIVPQNSRFNRGLWRTKVEAVVYDEVKKGRTVIFEVWPRYKTPSSTRPHVLVYSAKRTDGTPVLRRASIDNPEIKQKPNGGKGKGGGRGRGRG